MTRKNKEEWLIPPRQTTPNYQTQDGEPVSLDTLVKLEPEWAASRIRHASREHEALCAVADAWCAVRHLYDRSRPLGEALEYVEALTGESPCRRRQP